VDGLTTFFANEPGRGRVLRIDTDVRLAEADARWLEMEKPAAERPPAKPKGPTHPPKYDTVGGTTGAKIYSDYLRIEPGMRYRLRVDVKTTGTTAKIFIKGYAKLEGGFRKYYQCYKNVEKAPPGWHTYERTFNPTFRSPKVTHIRVMPYAYWPPGEVRVDNIEITRLGLEREQAGGEGGLLPNGGFDDPALDSWTTTGAAGRVERGTEGACARLGAGGTLTSARVPVEEDTEYRLTLRALPSGAILTARVEGLVRFGGKWTPLFSAEESAPPKAEDWTELALDFHPTAETPQVSHVRVVLSVEGRGSVFVDDVAIRKTEG
jgi:hypothetical protein